jgi:serine/threonine protein kinase
VAGDEAHPLPSLQQVLEENGPLPRPPWPGSGSTSSTRSRPRTGRAGLTCFGIATTTGDSHVTTGGAFIGSPSYMAPERAKGEEPRPPVDLWSLGATLYAAVEGRPPFDRGEAMATLLSVVSEHPAPMLRAGPLERVLRGLLTKDPAQRSTPAQVRGALAAVRDGGVPWPPPSPRGVAAPAAAPPPPPRQRMPRDAVTGSTPTT